MYMQAHASVRVLVGCVRTVPGMATIETTECAFFCYSSIDMIVVIARYILLTSTIHYT